MRSWFTHIFRHVLQNIGLHGHIDINGSSYPAELSLSHIQHPFDLPRLLATYDCALPCCAGDLFDGGLDFGESQEVNIGKLLLVLTILF